MLVPELPSTLRKNPAIEQIQKGRPDWFPWYGICAIALTRIPFRSLLPYDIDSVNFALAVGRFDPAAHQPHPPGYYLYVLLARLLNRIVPDPNAALVAISVTASCAAGWTIYVLTREWFGRPAARISMLLFLASPLGWFHGIVGLTYMPEAFFSALVGILCWRACAGQLRSAVPAAMVLGLAAGFRPSAALLLGPLLLWTLWQVSPRWRWRSMIAASLVMLAWIVPMAIEAGGYRRYLDAFRHLWMTVPGKRTVIESGWLAVARFLTIGWIFVLFFGAVVLLLFVKGGKPSIVPPRWRMFVILWTAPGLLFFIFVFLNYINSGYLLILTPPAFAWMASRIEGNLAGNASIRRTSLAVLTAVNGLLFLLAPGYWSYQSVRAFERDLALRTRELRRQFNPSETLIVGFDSHFLGYRHAGYSLPEFVTAQYPEVAYPDGWRVFLMHEGDTRLVRALPAEGLTRFAIYPLPSGASYSRYLAEVLAKLPEGSVTRLDLGPLPVWTGPMSVLPLLFPSTAR